MGLGCPSKVVGGGFDVVGFLEEMRSCQRLSASMRCFSEFIEMCLKDLPVRWVIHLVWWVK